MIVVNRKCRKDEEVGDKQKEERTYNIVNSVKGGCGKTTFSIWLAFYLNNYASDYTKGASCIIDMDLQGSSMVSLFHGSDANEKEYNYLHEWIRGYYAKGINFIQQVYSKGLGEISVIFSSPRQEDKNLYCAGARSNYSPVLEYGTFRLGIQRLLKEENEFKARKFKHIIFDMPPNTDGYSDSVLDCVLNPKYIVKDDKFKNQINLFMMLTVNISHLDATTNWLRELYTESNNNVPDQLFIVFNNNIVSENSEEKFLKICQNRMKVIKDVLLQLSIPEEYKKRIFFCVMNRNISFADYCAEGKGLELCEDSLLLDSSSFAKYAVCGDSEFKDITPEEFEKLILGRE